MLRYNSEFEEKIEIVLDSLGASGLWLACSSSHGADENRFHDHESLNLVTAGSERCAQVRTRGSGWVA